MGILKGTSCSSLAMNLYRNRAHHLIDRMSDAELETFWPVLETAYCDAYMLKAIADGRRTHNPGDTLTREEAMQLLPLLQPAPRTL
jgi:uncharacterized protein with gpF-like domain